MSVTRQSHPLLFVRAARGLPFKSGLALEVQPRKPSFLGSLLGAVFFLACMAELAVLAR